MNDKVRKNYFNKANRLIEALASDEIEDVRGPADPEANKWDVEDGPKKAPSKPSYDIDEEGDIGTETAKAILSTYIDRCVEEGTKELGDDYGLGDMEGGYEIVNDELERIAKQVKNYLKSVQ